MKVKFILSESLKQNFRFLYPLIQISTAKYGGFVSSIILNIETSCSGILHEINGTSKNLLNTAHRNQDYFQEGYRYFEFVTVFNKNISD